MIKVNKILAKFILKEVGMATWAGAMIYVGYILAMSNPPLLVLKYLFVLMAILMIVASIVYFGVVIWATVGIFFGKHFRAFTKEEKIIALQYVFNL